MTVSHMLGRVYRCPVCGAELTVVSFNTGDFAPRCCNVAMEAKPDRAVFYWCPVCGAMLTVMRERRGGAFAPRCCHTAMRRWAA
jgi:predicted RNA-binding Zn-ribbon protein involved in translation (DUF1610 family)